MSHHVIESQQFSRMKLEDLFSIAKGFEKKTHQKLSGKIMASLFYEPSTRTRFSFESAMVRLGGHVLSTENATEFSSVTKGETLEDTIHIMNQYADVIVLRHSEIGACERAARISQVPVINAGDGAGQHPTQALLDLYTIQRELGSIDNVNIAVMGDLKYGRTVRSLVYLLGKFNNVTIHFVSPKAFRIGRDIIEYLDRHDVAYEEHHTQDILDEVDVVYQTRIQKERFNGSENKDSFGKTFHLTPAVAGRMKKKSIIMHPLPRVDEIDPALDTDDRAVYFKQARFGMYVRMALLYAVLDEGQGVLL